MNKSPFFCPPRVGVYPSSTGFSTPHDFRPAKVLKPAPSSGTNLDRTVTRAPLCAFGVRFALRAVALARRLVSRLRGARGADQAHILVSEGATPSPATIYPRGPVLVRVCGWCQTVLGVKPGDGLERTALTHGMCEACQRKFSGEL